MKMSESKFAPYKAPSCENVSLRLFYLKVFRFHCHWMLLLLTRYEFKCLKVLIYVIIFRETLEHLTCAVVGLNPVLVSTNLGNHHRHLNYIICFSFFFPNNKIFNNFVYRRYFVMFPEYLTTILWIVVRYSGNYSKVFTLQLQET